MKLNLYIPPKDFLVEHPSKPFRRREILIRTGAILILGFLSPLVLFSYPVFSFEFLWLFLISVVRTALLWHGSMVIIGFWTSTYSIFSQAARLILFMLLTLAIFVLIVSLGEIAGTEWVTAERMSRDARIELVMTTLLITFLISSLYASTGFFMQWKRNLVKAQTLEKATLEAQFESLKTQVNPHFLFNSLNTLMSLVQGNADAERYIENLSEFMRYILKNRNSEAVSLKEELEVANQYLYLQSSRFPHKLHASVRIPDEYLGCQLPPLTLQMLIENAIKHNEISAEHPLSIQIYIKDHDLVVENNLNEKLEAEHSIGIGLENIRSRYQFLLGKDILVTRTDAYFRVTLPLDTEK